MRLGPVTLSPEVAALLAFPEEAIVARTDADTAEQEARTAISNEPRGSNGVRCTAVVATAWLQTADASSLNHRVAALPHGAAAESAFRHFFAYDAFASFVMAVAVLERALLELVTLAPTASGERRKPTGVLLKDLIASDPVHAALGTGAVGHLHALFSPMALNLRNLVWHGFLPPAHLDVRFAALGLLILLHALEAVCTARAAAAAGFPVVISPLPRPDPPPQLPGMEAA